MSTVIPLTVPVKTLAASIISTSNTFSLNNIAGWNGSDLTSADFGQRAFGALLSADRTIMELFEFDPSTIADGDISFITRGLDFKGGTVEVSANKLDWTANETFVLIGTDTPAFLASLASQTNDNTFIGINIFSQVPSTTGGDPLSAGDLTRKAYVDALVLGTLTTINVIVPGTAGTTIAAGNLIYFDDPTNRWLLCDADFPLTVQNVILGIAQGAGTSGNAITNGVLLQGVDTHQSGLTEGLTYYASNTAGGISSSAGTTNVVVGIGGQTATKLYFAPRFNQQLTQDQLNAMAGNSDTSPSATNPFIDLKATSNGSITDQTQATQNSSVTVGEADATTKHNLIAQSFVAARTNMLGVSINKQADTGSFTGTVKVALQANSAGSPSGSDLASITMTNAQWLKLQTGNFLFAFSAQYATVIGTTYWIVITCSTSDNSNHINLGINTAGGYAAGALKFKNTTDGWIAISTSILTFTTYIPIAAKIMAFDSNGGNPNGYFTDSGTTNAIMVSIPGLQALYTGLKFSVKVAAANSGAVTCNVNGTAVAVTKNGSVALVGGEFASGQIIDLRYDGTQLQIQAPISEGVVSAVNSATVDGAAHQVTKDSIIFGVANKTGSSNQVDGFEAYSDSSNPPTTVVAKVVHATTTAVLSFPFCFFVKAGNYYKITNGAGAANGFDTLTAFIISFG